MIEKVIKRDGRKTKFSERRIREAISGAMRNCGISTYNIIGQVTGACINAINVNFDEASYPKVEEIQDIIVRVLKEMDLQNVAEHFEEYRKDRTNVREIKSDVMQTIKKIGEETTRDNANVGNNFSAKLLQIASVANKYFNLASMPKEHSKAHERGDIHIHDVDSFNLTINCLHIDTRRKLVEGFNTGYGTIRSPKSIEAAGELSCILLQSTQNDMFGGQSHVNFDNDMASFVGHTRNKILKRTLSNFLLARKYIVSQVSASEDKMSITNTISKEVFICASVEKAVELINIPEVTKEYILKLTETQTKKSVRQAMQGVCYNLNTMHSRAGSQVPFSSINIGIPLSEDAALVCQMFLEEYDKGMGKGEQMIFPNIIFRTKIGVNTEENDPYRYLYDLAIHVAAHRMNPTFRNLDSSMDLPYYNRGILPATMGCRTNVMANRNGEDGPESRGNIAPCSLNMVRIGIESKGDWNKFFKLLLKQMILCKEELLYRYEVLKKLRIKDLPFVAGEELIKGSEGLNPEDSIEAILNEGTWGIGFIGLAETLIAMMGVHHGESQEAYSKAKEIMNFMSDRVEKFGDETELNFSLYATPAEGLSGRFTEMDLKRYGEIKNVTDRGFYTNSFHIPVYHNISALKKADLEAPFHKLCTGGMISYFEIDGGDTETREQYIHRHLKYCRENTNIVYVAYNFRIRYCKDCGTEATMDMTTCPNCGGNHFQGISRVTGYLSLDERFGYGKERERESRIVHEM